MAGKNDILATAGIDLSEFKAQINTLISEASRAGDAVEKTNKQFNVFGKTIGAGAIGAAAINFGANLFTNFTGANVALGDTNELFRKMKFEALGLGGKPSILTDIKNGAIDAIRDVPLVGKAIADLGDASQKQVRDALQITRAIATQAESYDALIAKRKELVAMKDTEAAKPVKSRSTPDSVQRLNKGIEEVDEKIIAMALKRRSIQEETTVGREQEVALNEIDIQEKQQLAAIAESMKNIIGISNQNAPKVFAANAAAIQAENANKRKLLEVSKQQEISEAGRLFSIKETGITYDDHLEQIEYAIRANNEVLEVIKKQKLTETLIGRQVAENGRQLAVNKNELIHTHDVQIEQAKNATREIEAHLAGNKKLAELESNRAKFELQIAEAARLHNWHVAEQLRRQERLNELEIKARDLMKTPKQREEERREQMKFDQAQRIVAAREKDRHERAEQLRKWNPARYGRMTDDQILGRDVRVGERISAATARARAEFAARQKQAPNQNAPANMALQNITAATIVVKSLEPAK